MDDDVRKKMTELVSAMEEVRSIICDAAPTGFNPLEGDWAERLFLSQGRTYRAVKDAKEILQIPTEKN